MKFDELTCRFFIFCLLFVWTFFVMLQGFSSAQVVFTHTYIHDHHISSLSKRKTVEPGLLVVQNQKVYVSGPVALH